MSLGSCSKLDKIIKNDQIIKKKDQADLWTNRNTMVHLLLNILAKRGYSKRGHIMS